MVKLRFTLLLWLCVYPFVSLLVWIIRDLIPAAPLLLFTLVLTLIIVPVMSYLIVPFVQRLTLPTSQPPKNPA